MLGFAWLTLRQAQEALKSGRLEEALRLLEQPGARSHRRTHELLVRLAHAFAERGERRLDRDDAEAAWRDLLQSEALLANGKTADRLRQTLLRLALAELRALLLAGETARAEEAVVHLRQRGVRSPELQVLEEGLRGWARARELADRGEFAPALDAAERAARLLGANPPFSAFRDELAAARDAFPGLLGRLHEAAEGERWREVVERAEQVLAAAPQHAEARALRARAWRALEPCAAPAGPEEGPAGQDPLPPRFLLWIDGVGGYLVCLGSRLTFGQSLPGARVDVPLVADVSRLHATLGRDAEGYVLEAVRPIQVNAGTATRALLQSGDRVTLGGSCQMQFRLCVPGNNTARLDLVSGHRLPSAADGVLLMAETLVLGPGPHAHIVIPDLAQPLILFRHKGGLGVRHAGELRVNGQKSGGRAILPPRAVVAGEDVAFAIEPAP
jgi:tetratricopeptide (TPR) repeat protein